MFVPNRELGDFLVDARLMNRADVERLLESEDNLYEAIRAERLVAEDELTRAAAHALGVPFAPLAHEEIDQDALLLIPEPLARAHSLALFKLEGSRAHVALTNLDHLAQLSFLEAEHHLRLVPRFADRASLKRALVLQQRRLKAKFAEKLKSALPGEAAEALVAHALLSRASDIYLSEAPNGSLKAVYRIGGVLRDAMTLAASARATIATLKESAGLSLTLGLPQEGRIKLALAGDRQVRVGVFCTPAQGGERVRLSLAPEQTGRQGFSLEALGLEGNALEAAHAALAQGSGLVLISSPQGQGKTTALYTLLDVADAPHLLAVSVEEHAALSLPGVVQLEVKKELGQTLGSAVRAALKQHPDVLMIDEIKTEDDAALAAGAASRGVLVLAGLRAGGAGKGIRKMLSLGVDPLLLAAALRLSISSRVVKKLCPHCREAYVPARADIAPFEKAASFARVLASLKAQEVVAPDTQWKDLQFFKAKGCGECVGGYRGEAGLFEVLPVSAIVKELIQDKNIESEAQESGLGSQTPLSLIEDGLSKAAQGLTTLEEVAEAAK